MNLLSILLLSLPLAATTHLSAPQSMPVHDQAADTLIVVDPVSVTADGIQRQITPVQSLAAEALQRLGVYSVADAVRYFAGVQIKDYGGIGGLKTVNVRSLGSHHVGVFYDGVEMGNAQNGVVDLGRFSLDNMEAVSIYNGQKSASLQTAKDYASSSALYLVTRTPHFEASRRSNLNIGIRCGSFGTFNPSILYEQRITDSLSASLSAEYMHTTGRYRFTYAKAGGYDTTEVRRNGDVGMLRAEAGLWGRIRGGNWRLKAYFYNSERGYPGAVVREEPGRFRHQDRQWDTNLFVQGSWRKAFGTRYSLLLNGKYARDYLHYCSDPRLDVTTMYVDNHYLQHELYTSAAHMFALCRWWSASLATDIQYNTLTADLTDFVYPRRAQLLTAGATSLDFKRFKLQLSLLHTLVGDRTRVESASAGSKSRLTPSAVVWWQPWPEREFHLRAFYKEIFRLPTLNDLYYTFIGNKALNPEYTIQYDVGFTVGHNLNFGRLRHIELQADGYYNRVKDKIIAMPTSNQFRWTMLNLGRVEIRGTDLSALAQFTFGAFALDTRVNYTYQLAQDCTDPDDRWYKGQIPYIPKHSGSLTLSGSWREWQCNYSFVYTGERYESVANIAENYSPAWYTHDISLSKSIIAGRTKLRFTAEINNLLDQHYEVVQCYPMPGINFRIKINIIL